VQGDGDATRRGRPADAGSCQRGGSRSPRQVLKFVRVAGPRRAISIALDTLRAPSSRPWYAAVAGHARGAEALEIGGPSAVFAETGRIPLAGLCRAIDLVDFSPRTIWSDAQSKVYGPPGVSRVRRRIVSDATDLGALSDESYDVVLASHVLEHIANPIRALDSWRRVLRPLGLLVVVVPNGSLTFDHRRTPTPIDHLIDDYTRGIAEDDISHLPEILRYHDLTMDPGGGSREEFVRRSENNASVRALHHHVFTLASLGAVLTRARFDVLVTAAVPPVHLLGVGRKTAGPIEPGPPPGARP
jgi:SAM-dependent methyltransferase